MGTASDPGSPSSPGVIARVQNASWFRELLDFWTKINNDWIFNLAGLLAYNFIVSLVPLLIVAVGSVGLFLGRQSDAALAKLITSIEAFLPDIAGVHELIEAQVGQRNADRLLLLLRLTHGRAPGQRQISPRI